MKITPSPQSDWQTGEAQPSPYGKVKSMRTEDIESPYRLIISTVVPRPIAFVSSLSKDGVHNLSPFSYFNAVSFFPPVSLFVFSLALFFCSLRCAGCLCVRVVRYPLPIDLDSTPV